MSEYLASLVSRTRPAAGAVRPRTASLFETHATAPSGWVHEPIEPSHAAPYVEHDREPEKSSLAPPAPSLPPAHAPARPAPEGPPAISAHADQPILRTAVTLSAPAPTHASNPPSSEDAAPPAAQPMAGRADEHAESPLRSRIAARAEVRKATQGLDTGRSMRRAPESPARPPAALTSQPAPSDNLDASAPEVERPVSVYPRTAHAVVNQVRADEHRGLLVPQQDGLRMPASALAPRDRRELDDAPASSPATSIVQVTIGRVEVRASIPPTRPKAGPTPSGTRLDEYLRSRAKGHGR